jgi:hypothetical protein
MDWKIFKNSYVAAFTAFIIVYLFMYIFVIGFEDKVNENGKIIKTPSWKLPLVIALIVWSSWYFYLFPVKKDLLKKEMPITLNPPKQIGGFGQFEQIESNNEGFGHPKIITDMWTR